MTTPRPRPALESDTAAHANLVADLARDIPVTAGLAQIIGDAAANVSRDTGSEPSRAAHTRLLTDLTTVLGPSSGLAAILATESEMNGVLDDLSAAIDTDHGLASILAAAAGRTEEEASRPEEEEAASRPEEDCRPATTVHHSVEDYRIPPDASVRRKFRIARAYLGGGLATTARRLMDEVVFEMPDWGAVRFYWLLAFFSGRAPWEMSDEDRGKLRVFLGEVDELDLGTWAAGVDLIRRLVTATEGDVNAIVKEFDELPPAQRAKILRHLERVLAGQLKDELWRRDVEQALALQRDGGREDRVWKFFEPEPARPRTRVVRPPETTVAQQALAALATAVLVAAAGVTGWLLMQRDNTAAIVAVLVALVGAGVALTNGAEWRFRNDRLRAQERAYRGYTPGLGLPPTGGFATEVDRLYQHYFAKYAPPEPERDRWLLATGGIACTLRDETVEVYQEGRTSAAEIKWLIRFQARQVRKRWLEGSLKDHRQRWATPYATRAGTVLGLVVAGVAGVWALEGAVHVHAFTALAAALLAVPAASAAGATWLRILVEAKRFATERAEHEERMTSYWFEYQRWRHKLSDRPADGEMATWLDCDRRLVTDRVLRMYQLHWNDVTAYASLEAPAFGSRRARVPHGPWRYDGYQLLVFLLTPDGVRQVTVGLDFARAALHTWQRAGFRFDAVAAVRVIAHEGGDRHFELSLINGEDIEVAVSTPETSDAGEDAGMLADAAMDATGLRTTMFVLDGVAADGRGRWDGPAFRRAG